MTDIPFEISIGSSLLMLASSGLVEDEAVAGSNGVELAAAKGCWEELEEPEELEAAR